MLRLAWATALSTAATLAQGWVDVTPASGGLLNAGHATIGFLF